MRPLISDERLKELDGYTRIYDTTNEGTTGMAYKSEYMRGMEMMRQEYEKLVSSTRTILMEEIKHRCPVCEKGRMPSRIPAFARPRVGRDVEATTSGGEDMGVELSLDLVSGVTLKPPIA